MSKKLLVLLLSLAILLLAGCSAKPPVDSPSAPAVEQNEACVDEIKDRGYIVVGCKSDVPDLSCYDEATATFSGIEVDYAYKLGAKIFDCTPDEARDTGKVKLIPVTVADREDKLSSGEIDIMLATYTITDERATKFALSNSYYTDYIGIMVKSGVTDNESLGSADINSLADLDGAYIGVPRNATTRADFIDYINTGDSIKVHPIFCEFESYEQLYDALMNDNINAMAVDVSILNGYNTQNTKILAPRFAAQNYGAAAKLENQKLIDLFNEII